MLTLMVLPENGRIYFPDGPAPNREHEILVFPDDGPGNGGEGIVQILLPESMF
jgi:hypothetical protein